MAKREDTPYLNKFNSMYCPKCGSNKIKMNLSDINTYVCKRCGKKFSVDYD